MARLAGPRGRLAARPGKRPLRSRDATPRGTPPPTALRSECPGSLCGHWGCVQPLPTGALGVHDELAQSVGARKDVSSAPGLLASSQHSSWPCKLSPPLRRQEFPTRRRFSPPRPHSLWFSCHHAETGWGLQSRVAQPRTRLRKLKENADPWAPQTFRLLLRCHLAAQRVPRPRTGPGPQGAAGAPLPPEGLQEQGWQRGRPTTSSSHQEAVSGKAQPPPPPCPPQGSQGENGGNIYSCEAFGLWGRH